MREAPIESIVEKALECLKNAKQCYSGEMYDVTLNRAYYAMFHSIQALLSSIGASLNKSHTGTHNAFHKDFIATGIIPREYGLPSNVYSSSDSLVITTIKRYVKKKQPKALRMPKSLFWQPFNI